MMSPEQVEDIKHFVKELGIVFGEDEREIAGILARKLDFNHDRTMDGWKIRAVLVMVSESVKNSENAL